MSSATIPPRTTRRTSVRSGSAPRSATVAAPVPRSLGLGPVAMHDGVPAFVRFVGR